MSKDVSLSESEVRELVFGCELHMVLEFAFRYLVLLQKNDVERFSNVVKYVNSIGSLCDECFS